jgi:Type VI secretion system/phage-baseplate injector OB domain
MSSAAAGAGGAAAGAGMMAGLTAMAATTSATQTAGGAAATVAMATATTCSWQVLVAGTPLSLNPAVAGLQMSCEVDSTLFTPSQFKLVFQGMPDNVLLPSGLQLAVPVTILGPLDVPLLTGEVTAVEIDHCFGQTLTIVRGMDRSHRLMRGTNTMAYPEMTASDVVMMLVGQAGLVPAVEPTSTIYPWLSQANVSNWTFIQQLASLENCVAYADGLGIFHFCPMPMAEAGLPPSMSYELPDMGTQLVLGKNLKNLRAVVSSAEQVPAVTVTGYDPQLTIPVIGPFPSIPSVSQSLDPMVLPPAVAGEMGAMPFFDSSFPFDNEGAAMTRAQSIASDIAGSLSEVEGECLGNTSLLAGASVTIGMAGQPFDGYYICSAARHVFDPANGGYSTWVTVGGYQDRSMFSLASGAPSGLSTRPTIPGLVIGTVVNNIDPKNMGQVQVMFPWLNPSYISAWCRVMQIGASKLGAGFLWVPEIGDEVLIGFDRGFIDKPYVIGNLYNGINLPIPPPSVEGVVANRRIGSRGGHIIQFDDGPSPLGLTLAMGMGAMAPVESATQSIKMDGEQMQITINSLTGQVQITGTVGVTIKSEAQIAIAAPTISIGDETTMSLTLAGTSLSFGGPGGSPAGTIAISGASVSLGPG